MSRKFFRMRRWLVLGVAAGALGITAAAQARPVLDEGNGAGAPSIRTQYWTAVDSFYKNHATALNAGGATADQTVNPGRPVYLGPDGVPAANIVGPSDVFERTVQRGPEAYYATQAVPVTGGSEGFNWGDFTIGIGAALGAMLAAALIAQLSRNRRRLATLH